MPSLAISSAPSRELHDGSPHPCYCVGMKIRNLWRNIFSVANKSVTNQTLVDVPGGKVATYLFNSTQNSRSEIAPLVVIHGGPGFPHSYLLPLAVLETDRPILFYDQLGCGCSDKPEFSWCWSVPRFVAELEAVREWYGFKELNLLGHSWGSIVALEYALNSPQRVKSLILASPCISIPMWIADAERLARELPSESYSALKAGEATFNLSSPEYQAALQLYCERFVYRVSPLPKGVNDSIAEAGGLVYQTMWGPNERFVTGTLKDYDRTAELKNVSAPILLTCGRFDEATPEALGCYAQAAGKAESAIFEESAHLPHITESERYIACIRSFLSRTNLT